MSEDTSPLTAEDTSATTEDALAASEDTTPIPAPTTSEPLVDIADAAALSELEAALASGDPIAQVQALGIATDPSQVEGYDPAADGALGDYDEYADEEGISAQSEDSIRVGDWSYHESEDSNGQTIYVLDGYYGSATSITLPATLDGKPIYSVCFWKERLGSYLPKTVTSVTVPASIKEIGAWAFYGTKLANITFAANSQLTSIGNMAFWHTCITEFTIPAHVKTLGNRAFNDSSITKLTLNADLEPMVYMDQGSTLEHFNPCSVDHNVTFVVPSNCKNYRVENGALLSRDGTILYAQMSDLHGGTYTVPSSVKYLGACAMYGNTTFSKIVLPQGLTTMERLCLYGTNITSLDMPDSVTQVQGDICGKCTRLTSVRISNNLEKLGENPESTGTGRSCFAGCSNLTNVTLGSKLRIIATNCFTGTKLTSIYLPDSLEQINYGAFYDVPTLKSVTGGAGLRYIYGSAFYNAGLTSFPFGENLEFVSKYAFSNCQFTPSYPSYMNQEADGYYATHDTLAVRGNKSYTLAWQVLDLVNQERAKENLAPLTMDAELLDVAMQRAAETAVCFDHTRPTGQKCFTVSAKMTRENIASGNGCTTAELVVAQWMDSDGHRANILSSDSKSIGVGCFVVNGWYFWVQCFGSAEATAASHPADVTDTLMKVAYTEDGLSSFGSRFEIYPVASDGTTIVSTSGALQEGTSQRYALFTYPWGAKRNVVTAIDDSCIAWSISGTGASLQMYTETATVTGKGAGSFTLTASVGGGTVQQTLTRETKAAVYTVSFNSNGGSAVASQSVTSGSTAKKPDNPSKSGYTFTGWYSDSALTKAYDFSTAVKGNRTLYAGWQQIIYTVSFNANGGSGVASQTVVWGAKASKPGNPTRNGYVFTGWYSDKALSKAYDFGTAVKGNVTLYAGWKQATYTVSFNANGGSAVASQTVAWGAKASKPGNPTRSGYTFGGWYSDSALSKAYDFSAAVKGNLTLYAKWAAQAASPFKDVPAGKWYTDWVSQAAKAGLMTGHKGADGKYTGYFEPNGTITRAQVATVLWRIAGSPSASAGAFSDMSGHWAATAVAWCSAKGIVTGYTGGPDAGKFVPDRQVSRQELAVMVWRFAKWSGVKTANPPTAAFNSCGDAALVPDWSRQAMTWCAAAGVITGVQGGAKPMLCPQDGATRAMAAKIFVQTQKIASGAVSPYAEDGAADEAQAGPDEVTFDDVQDGAAVADEAFDAVEPGEAGTTGEAADGSGSKPEQADGTTGDATGEATGEPGQADGAGDISTDEPDEATGVAEYPGNDESAAADDPDVNATPADSADIAEPDAAADAFAEPAESEEAPAADVADAPDPEAVSFDPLDDAFAA